MNALPLAGRRVLVTRRPEQAGSLSAGLRTLGAEVIEVATVAIAPPVDVTPLDDALRRLKDYDWLVFTSANAVSATAARMSALANVPTTVPRIASVGSATSDAIARQWPGTRVALEPASDFRAEGLLAAFRALGESPALRCLLPLADRARDTLRSGLRDLGYRVDDVTAYRTVTPPDLRIVLEKALGTAELGVFASPSAVEGFVNALGERSRQLPVVVIGPTTEQAARVAGLEVRAVATPATVPGLIEAVVRLLARAS
jgi:uroporphyrinogen-III synthase